LSPENQEATANLPLLSTDEGMNWTGIELRNSKGRMMPANQPEYQGDAENESSENGDSRRTPRKSSANPKRGISAGYCARSRTRRATIARRFHSSKAAHSPRAFPLEEKQMK
jgi:hypothetical protein